MALAAAVLVGVVKVAAATLGRPFPDYGDVAVIELQVRRALHFQAQLGPYSRFGWHHPGPAYLYFLAPFYALGGEGTRALFLGALVVNVGAAVATVAVVRRHAGERAGRWTLATVALLLLAIDPQGLINPWNPSVLALPVLLAVVLAAAGAGGSRSCLIWSAVVGSFAVQTHIATGPEVALALAVGGAGLLLGWRRRSRPSPISAAADRRPRTALVRSGLLLGVGLLVAMWVPPVYQEITTSPGNLTKIFEFFTASRHPGLANGHPLGQALGAVINQETLVPAWRLPPASSAAALTHASALREALAAAYLVDAVGVMAMAAWLRRRLALALGTIGALGPVAAVVATTRVVGPIDPYLVQWMSVLPVPAWIGSGIVVREWWLVRSSRPAVGAGGEAGGRGGVGARAAGAGLAVAALIPTALLARSFAQRPTYSFTDFTETPVLARIARADLARLHARYALVRFANPDRWPIGAGVMAELASHGIRLSVTPEWVVTFGSSLAATGAERATVVFADAPGQGGPRPPPGASQVSGPSGLTEMWVRSSPRRSAGGSPAASAPGVRRPPT